MNKKLADMRTSLNLSKHALVHSLGEQAPITAHRYNRIEQQIGDTPSDLEKGMIRSLINVARKEAGLTSVTLEDLGF